MAIKKADWDKSITGKFVWWLLTLEILRRKSVLAGLNIFSICLFVGVIKLEILGGAVHPIGMVWVIGIVVLMFAVFVFALTSSMASALFVTWIYTKMLSHTLNNDSESGEIEISEDAGCLDSPSSSQSGEKHKDHTKRMNQPHHP